VMDERARRIALECKGFMHDEEGMRLHELRARARAARADRRDRQLLREILGVHRHRRARGRRRALCIDHHRGSKRNQAGWEYPRPGARRPAMRARWIPSVIRRTLEQADLERNVVLMVTDSVMAASIVPGPIGMLFIDGGHSFDSAFADYEAWSDKIARGGVLAIHDLFPDPQEGGQAPIEVYRRAVASGKYEELPTVRTLGVLRRR